MTNSVSQSIANVIWNNKYRYRLHGEVIDKTLEDTWRRVAHAIASSEKPKERAKWEAVFYQILTELKFLPGGRIIAGAGTLHQVTLFNCFVMDLAEDSLPAIFQALQEGVITLQHGGGVGYDFSILRPQGDLVKKTGMQASGPVAFMQIWDTMSSVLLSTGARRGAMMGVLRCDHPDIEAFVRAKRDPQALRHFNVSILVSDAFMQAVKNNAEWPLIFPAEVSPSEGDIIYRQWGNEALPVACRVYRNINARELWREIMQAAYDYAEPGVIFVDTVNRMNTLYYRETIHATNPCGEIPLPTYGACNLGAINLTKFVHAPFTKDATLDWKTLENTVQIATRFQDNVIDVSQYPFPMQQEQAVNTRRIGLGVTGLADMFVMLGIRYGSHESIALAKELMQRVADTTWWSSVELAKEKGKFPYFSAKYCEGEFVKQLPETLQTAIKQYGIRNSHHNTIAPAGTISLLAHNVSNGIEPIFQADYIRYARLNGNAPEAYSVQDYAYLLWRETHEGLPPAWVDTETLSPDAHLAIQGAMQPFIDNAISKTINIPRDFPFDDLADVYTKAYDLGLKGCTIFRPNAITGSVLHVNAEAPATDFCCQFE